MQPKIATNDLIPHGENALTAATEVGSLILMVTEAKIFTLISIRLKT